MVGFKILSLNCGSSSVKYRVYDWQEKKTLVNGIVERVALDDAFIRHEIPGKAVIHRKDLAPLDNLELLSQAPNLTLESYRALGRNAARYALGLETEPIPVKIDNTSRLRHIVQTTLLHRIEVEATVPGAKPVEVELVEDTVAVNDQDSKLRKQR